MLHCRPVRALLFLCLPCCSISCVVLRSQEVLPLEKTPKHPFGEEEGGWESEGFTLSGAWSNANEQVEPGETPWDQPKSPLSSFSSHSPPSLEISVPSVLLHFGFPFFFAEVFSRETAYMPSTAVRLAV
eukprot:RCo019780